MNKQKIIEEFRKQFGEDDPIVADKKDIEQFIIEEFEKQKEDIKKELDKWAYKKY